ncbi:hypothetical protein [Neisseria sicca]|uniref:hypothetical protein n=1 Tax=Neisseria sicca TaxID=490 RepID=UPI0011BD0188|nr:hypothetical protein [Neisseria sicca]
MDIAKTSIRATLSFFFCLQGRTWNADGNSARKERQRSSENPKPYFQTTFDRKHPTNPCLRLEMTLSDS